MIRPDLDNADSVESDDRVLLLAPTARDRDATAAIFAANGIVCHRCDDIDALRRERIVGAAALILPEEAVLADAIAADRLAEDLRGQPVWSDLPVIILSRAGTESPAVARALATLGNVTVVERPMRVTTLLSIVGAARRARRRQYEVRDQLIASEGAAVELSAAVRRLDHQTRLFDNVASATPDFLYVFDLDARFRYANRRLLEVFGVDSLAAEGTTFEQLGYPDWHAAMHRAEIARVIANRDIIRGEVPFTGLSGQGGIYDYIFTPVIGPGGDVEAISGTTRDVTERKRREDRDRFLIALDDATRALVDPAAVIQVSAELLGEKLGVNRCAYAEVQADEDTFDLTGDFSRDVPSIVGRYRFADFGAETLRLMRADLPFIVDDVERDPRVADVLSAYHATEIRAVICVPLMKAGRFVAAMAVHQAQPRVWRPDEVELLRRVAARCWESIERARVTRRLADNEQRLRLAVDAAKLGVWELDLRTREMTCSTRCKSNYGRQPAEPFTYQQLFDSIHPDDRDRVLATLADALKRRVEYEVEYRTIWPDLTHHWASVRARTSYADDGTAMRMVGVSLDITAARDADAERAELLAREQAARIEAERASRMKDEFLATLSHELRTPLSAILGWSQILGRGNAKPEAIAEGVRTIERNARAQTQIIEDLLDMSRIISGKVSLDTRRIDLASVITAAIETVRPASAAKEIDVRVDSDGLTDAFDAARLPILGDPNRLQQVFWNLLSNAIKFTPRGGQVRVNVDRDASQWRVAVVDTGEGIAAEFLPHVFDRFRQADASTTRRHGGLGLGLAIVKQLVELHGGKVDAFSAGKGGGSTFSVMLPMSATHEPSPSMASLANGATVNTDQTPTDGPPAPPWDAALCMRLSGMSALIVDDEPDARGLLQQLLEECDMTVFVASNAAEAFAQLAAHRPDVLVSDIGMPGEDGHSLIRRIRQLSAAAGGLTPAIALTAYARAEDRVKAIRAGFQLHVPKPVEPAELLTMVASLVGRAVA